MTTEEQTDQKPKEINWGRRMKFANIFILGFLTLLVVYGPKIGLEIDTLVKISPVIVIVLVYSTFYVTGIRKHQREEIQVLIKEQSVYNTIMTQKHRKIRNFIITAILLFCAISVIDSGIHMGVFHFSQPKLWPLFVLVICLIALYATRLLKKNLSMFNPNKRKIIEDSINMEKEELLVNNKLNEEK